MLRRGMIAWRLGDNPAIRCNPRRPQHSPTPVEPAAHTADPPRHHATDTMQTRLTRLLGLDHPLLQAPNCLGAGNLPLEPHPAPIPLDEQASITFFEVYASPEAFSAHVNGAVFQNFLSTYSHCFKQDPERPGWPITVNASLTPLAGFTRVPGD